MIGSSGSFDSFMEMIWASKGVDKLANEVVSEQFDLTELGVLHAKLIGSDLPQRKAIPGLVEMRADTIHLASCMVHWIREKIGLERLLLSSYALKEGVVSRAIRKMKNER